MSRFSSHALDLGFGDDSRQAVRAEQEPIAGAHRVAEQVQRQRRLDADGSRDRVGSILAAIQRLPRSSTLWSRVRRSSAPARQSIDPAVARPEDGAASCRAPATRRPCWRCDRRAWRCGAGPQQVLVDQLQALPGRVDRPVERRVRHAARASASQTMWLATSPSRWPPRPSATAHTPISGRSMKASSLMLRAPGPRRSRPPTGSPTAPCSSDRHLRRSRRYRRAPTPTATATAPTRRPATPRTCPARQTLRDQATRLDRRRPFGPPQRQRRRTSTTIAATAAARTPARAPPSDPIGICHDVGGRRSTMRRGRGIEHDARRHDRRFESTRPARRPARRSARNRCLSVASVSMIKRSARSKNGRRLPCSPQSD